MSDPDKFVDQLIAECDDTVMQTPEMESDPHLLISKVRKHYMDYMIKLLSVNYETHQRLLNKNIYLPSAIWRCAKTMETQAAQSCMVVQLYRKNMVNLINDLKNDTQKGKLNKKLYACLLNPSENEKKLQTSFDNNLEDCKCQCDCKPQNKRRKLSNTALSDDIEKAKEDAESTNYCKEQNELTTVQGPAKKTVEVQEPPKIQSNKNQADNIQTKRMSVESQDSDELMMQLEKLFEGDTKDDDLFEGTLCDNISSIPESGKKEALNNAILCCTNTEVQNQVVIEHQAAQIRSLDERLASLTGLLIKNSDRPQPKEASPRPKRMSSSKWLCEEYYTKSRLFELLDHIGDVNRMRLVRVRGILTSLFGDDSDDDGIMSPFEETTEFVISCKERIAPWVVKLLTPYYFKGRIIGKTLFKSLAKHLIRLIYQCSRYPNEYEVRSFVTDFLDNHQVIRTEEDFKQFRIDNLLLG